MLRIITANQQEALFALLAERLHSPSGDNPLTPETLVCERGMDRWLSLQLAERRGIAANLDCQLPAAFIWKILDALAPDDAATPLQNTFDRHSLTWRLLRIVPILLQEKIPNTPDFFAPLRHYLAAGADHKDGRKLYQLCRRLADTFDNYLIYRPQLIRAWEAERCLTTHPDTEQWQSVLWRALVSEGGNRHRLALMQRFCILDDKHRRQQTCFKHPQLPARISVFGIPALPPSYVDIFSRLARHTQLDLYVLSPSQDFWGDLLTPAAMARIEQHTGYAFDIPNRLLAANGQPVRHFLSSLADQEAEHIDAFVEPNPNQLLGRIQADILNLSETRAYHYADDDNSLHIVNAHGPLREVEILHNNLLAMFNADPSLRPQDVLVMTPDMNTFAPAITAVFAAAEGKNHIPWSMTDVPPRGTQPLMQAFENLLRLPDSRLTVNDVLALLESPAIAARFQMDPADVALIRTALGEANVRWGLDATARKRAKLPAEHTHTWQFALDRLFMGLAVGDSDTLSLGIAPCAAFEGKQAVILGRLQDFIDRLAHWQQNLSIPKTAAAWADCMYALSADFFTPTDSHDDMLLDTLFSAIRDFRDETAAAAFMAPLPPNVFRDDLLVRLDSVATPGGLFTGAVTCCRMTPMRSLPFRVIALLGMNGDAFPRRQPKNSFDLIDLEPQAGDRARRLDDRHLFLETLLSARERLYISYSGRSARDNSAREPSVLVSELMDTVAAMCSTENPDVPATADSRQKSVLRQLSTEHPLQSFSRRYFDGSDARLFSFDHAGLTAADSHQRLLLQSTHKNLPTWKFCQNPLPAIRNNKEPVSLTELIRFFNHPVREFLRGRLGIAVFHDADLLPDDEPFDIDALTAYHLAESRLAMQIAHPDEGGGDNDAAWQNLLRARGDLPVGAFAESTLTQQRHMVNALHARIAPHLPGLHNQRIALDINGCRLTGLLRNINEAGVLRYSVAALKGKRAFALWLEHLALCADGNLPAPRSLLLARDQTWTLQPVAPNIAIKYLTDLMAIRSTGLCEPLPLFADTSFAWATAKTTADTKKVDVAWHGSRHQNGRSGEAEDPSHRMAFAALDEVLDAQFVELAERVWKPLLQHVLIEGSDTADTTANDTTTGDNA